MRTLSVVILRLRKAHDAARRFGRFVALLGVLLGWCSGANAQPSGSDAERWFRSMAKEALQPPSLGNVRLEWVAENHSAPSPDELRKMRQDVQEHPEHPMRSMLPVFERRAAGKPDLTDVSVWWLGANGWRYNRTPLGEDGAPTGRRSGFASDGARAWVLTESSATVVMASAPPSPEYDYASVSGEVARAVGLVLYGGMGELVMLNPVMRKFNLVGSDGWRADFDADAERRMVVMGRWVFGNGREKSGHGEFERTEIYGPDDVSTPSMVFLFSGWEMNEVIGRYVPRQVERLEGGRLAQRWKFRAATMETATDMRNLLSPPAQGKRDPARGVLRLEAVTDYVRGRQSQYDDKESDVMSTSVPLDGGRAVVLRRIGWVVAGLIAIALVAMRVRKAV